MAKRTVCACLALAPLVIIACGESSTPFEGDATDDGGGESTTGGNSSGGGSGASSGSGGTSSGSGGTSGASGTATGGAAGDGASSGASGNGGSKTGGAGGSGGTAGGGAVGGTNGANGGQAGSGGAGGTCGNCDWTCCGSVCVNQGNDVKNCGACGHSCSEGESCNDGVCGPPPCSDPPICIGTAFCCGTACCQLGNLCCVVPGPVGPSEPQCVEPNERGTCPLGCRTCRCASPETPIATPDGERALGDLRVGDLVYSVDNLAIVAVPILAVHRQPAQGHAVPHVILDDGRTLEVSAGHPTADGRTFGDLAPGDRLGERTVARITYAAYRHPFTYDILPDSSTGTYFAAGALVATTLVR